jgi:hypothetical protein
MYLKSKKYWLGNLYLFIALFVIAFIANVFLSMLSKEGLLTAATIGAVGGGIIAVLAILLLIFERPLYAWFTKHKANARLKVDILPPPTLRERLDAQDRRQLR